MRPLNFVLFIFLSLAIKAVGQQHFEIEGKVINMDTGEAIPYANIYNKSIEKGTISNTDGYFRVPVNTHSDTIIISFIGFQEQKIKLQPAKDFYTIRMEENNFLLDEVTIKPKDDYYLFDLIQECSKRIPKIARQAKTYYELKSYNGDTQLELVEGYYNLDIVGYNPKKLHLKAGRLALNPQENRFFVSLESSSALLMLDLFDKSSPFPQNPLSLSKSKLRKNYYLYLENKYLDQTNDSIYVVEYKPRVTSGLFFEGKIWINKSKNHIVKINLICNSATRHPFRPLFSPFNSISNLSLNITHTFKTIDNQPVFNHLDFVYKTDYRSSIESEVTEEYSITTAAVLYAYDYYTSFQLPYFDFHENSFGDYRKINALPYNDFFWSFNDEYRLNDSLNRNELFFSDSTNLSSKALFDPNATFTKGFFEHLYLKWSKDRIQFREILVDTSIRNTEMKFISDQYNLAFKIFMDVNSYKDSTHILTSTIADPFESYFFLPLDNQRHCFINTYFDLCEIERRKLEKECTSAKDPERIREIYENFYLGFISAKKEYLKNAQLGTNEEEMVKYNKLVFDQLGIDNIEIFKPFEKE